MKAKTFVILVLVLGVVAGLTALILSMNTPKQAQIAMGEKLYPGFDVNAVESIKVTTPDETFTVTHTDKGWMVRERQYSADFSKVSRFLKKLEELEVGHAFSGDRKSLESLQLIWPGDSGPGEAKGALFEMSDKSGKILATLMAGKDKSSRNKDNPYPTGQYVQKTKDGMVYVVAPFFENLDQAPGKWLITTLVRMPEDQVKEIICYKKENKDFKRVFVIARPEKGKPFEPVDFPIAAELDTYRIDRMAQALSSLAMEDLERPEKGKEPVFDAYLEYKMFDGTLCRVYKGPKSPGGCKIRLEVDYEKSGPDSAEGKEQDEKLKAMASQLNEKLSQAIFILSGWRCDTLVTDPVKLVEVPQTNTGRPGMPAGMPGLPQMYR